MDKIDIYSHYFPPAYNQMLDRRNMKFLDGGFPRPEWNEEIHLSSMEKLGITYSVLSISSPHLHMGDAQEAIEVARASNHIIFNSSNLDCDRKFRDLWKDSESKRPE